MSENKRPLKVFLCHTSADKPAVRKLYKRLVADGVNAWLDVENLLPGQKWEEEIAKAIRESDVVIVCLSEKSINKEGFVQKEIKFALDVADEKTEGTIYIIPARLEECKVPDRLKMYQWVDLFQKSGYGKLKKSLNARAEKIGATLVDKIKKNALETTEKLVHEKEEKEIAEKARLEAEELARQKAAKEKADREAAEKIAREKAEKEAAEKERLEAEEIARQKAAKEKADREAAEKAAREKAEKDAAEKALLEAEERARQEVAQKSVREEIVGVIVKKITHEKARLESEDQLRQKAAKEAAQKAAKEKEIWLDQLYTEGLVAFYTEDWDKANQRFQTILKEQPDNKNVTKKLIEIERQKESAEKAAREKAEKEAAKNSQLEAEEQARLKAAKEKAKSETIERGRRSSGFSGIEIVVTVIIFGCVAAILTLLFSSFEKPNITDTPVITPTANFVAPIKTIAPTFTRIVVPTVTKTKFPTPTHTPAPTKVPTEITDFEGVSMRLVPAGEFTMGSDDEKPIHQVILDAFYIDTYEVTNARYKACVDAGGCTLLYQTVPYARSNYYGNPEFNDYPMINVDWNQASAYCQWRGGNLPTEAQWEKAARGTDGRTYPWGEDISCYKLSYNNCKGGATKVGSYESGKSPYGIYDLAGNVEEWTADWYSDTYYQNSPSKNPLGPDSGEYRVRRGGSWNNNDYNVRSASRDVMTPNYFSNYLGFRCARSLP